MNTRKVRFVPVALPVVLSLGAVVALGGCAAETAKADGPSSGETGLVARAAEPSDGVLVLGSTEPAELALTSSQAFFTNAPVVVLATADDEAARATAAAAAVELAAPVLLVGGAISDGGLRTELSRLGTVAVAPGKLPGAGAGGLVRPLVGPSAGARRGRPGRRPSTGAPAPVVPCLLVDDVVTTGATLAACERALTSAGALVLGAVALAATPSPGERRRSAGQPP
ncbi:ComF family protein [Cellulosimicrobium cellulans]|uniref:ComF family protein n=1 Tax=Cellulosimicrobium cellulans TaxID=1710 RepID=UPI0018843AC3|nr:hypothetical protein [Cellulosimicrobium cellulans]